MVKALYGMLTSALQFYRQLKNDIEETGFQINPYDPYVANMIVNGKQQTIAWHVDDIKSSHKDKEVNAKFLKLLETKYGSNKVGKVKYNQRKIHQYLGMELDYSKKEIFALT